MKAERMVDPDISDPDKDYISILVDDTFPANKKGVIIKSQKDIIQYDFKVKKFDELKGELHFCTFAAAELDTDKQFMKSQDIDHMHDGLMKNLKHTRLADINHDQKRLNDVWINEIWKERDAEGNTISSNGVYVIKENAYLMQKAREGKINGVSIMGRVKDIVIEEISKSDNGIFTMLKAIHDKIFGKEEIKIKQEVDMTKEQIKALSDEELKEFGFMRIPETTEAPATETQVEPDKEKEELKSANEKLTADLESLKAEMKDIIKQRTSDPTEKSELKSAVEPIKKAQWEKLDTFDKHNFKIEFPEIANKYENGL